MQALQTAGFAVFACGAVLFVLQQIFPDAPREWN